MKKLRLEELSVESFDTTRSADDGRGTVRGHSGNEGTYCIYTCGHCESFVECTNDSCHPYTCSESYDYTFCDCNTENDYTCYTQC